MVMLALEECFDPAESEECGNFNVKLSYGICDETGLGLDQPRFRYEDCRLDTVNDVAFNKRMIWVVMTVSMQSIPVDDVCRLFL